MPAKSQTTALKNALSNLISAVDCLIGDSGGVYGLHLNGDCAPWASLTQGGQFEEWLIELETAREVLAKALQQEAHHV